MLHVVLVRLYFSVAADDLRVLCALPSKAQNKPVLCGRHRRTFLLQGRVDIWGLQDISDRIELVDSFCCAAILHFVRLRCRFVPEFAVSYTVWVGGTCRLFLLMIGAHDETGQ